MSNSSPESALGSVSQEELLAFLRRPTSYAHRPKQVCWVQTHASFLFLVPPFVFKVKKPVNFGFLDFSTLEKRRYYCNREIELNRRMTQGVYLGVVPISLTQGQLAFGPGDVEVEYAVQMRLLPSAYFLDHLLSLHRVGAKEMIQIADRLASFYRQQQPKKGILSWGKISKLQISTEENFRQIAPFSAEFLAQSRSASPSKHRSVKQSSTPLLSRATFEAIRWFTRRFFRYHAGLFRERVHRGRIRDCHGDLHLEHIHLSPQGIQIYDCIEFNDRFRYVDIANEVAFLAMDLDYEHRSDLSETFLSRVAEKLRDPELLRLTDFYKCYRAVVRGKVEGLHSQASTAPQAEQSISASRARRYFQLALRYAVAGSAPQVWIFMGKPGSGKSALARQLGGELDWRVISSDAIRKASARFPIHKRPSLDQRRALYSSAMTRKVYKQLWKAAQAHVTQGRSVVLDATFSLPEQRTALIQELNRNQIEWRFFEAHAKSQEIQERLRARDHQSHVVSDARIEDFPMLAQRYQPPSELPRERCWRISTRGPVQEVARRLLRRLAILNAHKSGGPARL